MFMSIYRFDIISIIFRIAYLSQFDFKNESPLPFMKATAFMIKTEPSQGKIIPTFIRPTIAREGRIAKNQYGMTAQCFGIAMQSLNGRSDQAFISSFIT